MIPSLVEFHFSWGMLAAFLRLAIVVPLAFLYRAYILLTIYHWYFVTLLDMPPIGIVPIFGGMIMWWMIQGTASLPHVLRNKEQFLPKKEVLEAEVRKVYDPGSPEQAEKEQSTAEKMLDVLKTTKLLDLYAVQLWVQPTTALLIAWVLMWAVKLFFPGLL